MKKSSSQLSSWLNHPKVRPAREGVVFKLRAHRGYFRHLGAVVFLCGGMGSDRRDYLAKYLRRQSNANVFYAEDVWRLVSEHRSSDNALAMESDLASFADVVALIVESPGTFCELGAFAHNLELRKKLLLVLDKRYKDDDSFIAKGPVRWVDAESDFGPALWVDMDQILMNADAIVERVRSVKSSGARGAMHVLSDPKMTLVFLVDLATIFGPCTIQDLIKLTEDVLGQTIQPVPYPMLLGLAVALGLLAEQSGFYSRPIDKGDINPYRRPSRSLNILEMRATIVSVRQQVAHAWPFAEEVRAS